MVALTHSDQYCLILLPLKDVEVFVSVYMKNEKYRLQIKKSSLLAFAKAYEHMLTGALAVASKANSIMEKISPSSDVIEFVHSHRKPYQRSKRIVPTYHNNDILKDALSEYYRTKMSSPPTSGSEERKQRRSPKASEQSGSPQQTMKKRELALDLEVITSTSGANHADRDELESNTSLDRSSAVGETMSNAESSDTENDAQPLAMSDFQKKFQVSGVLWFRARLEVFIEKLTLVVMSYVAGQSRASGGELLVCTLLVQLSVPRPSLLDARPHLLHGMERHHLCQCTVAFFLELECGDCCF